MMFNYFSYDETNCYFMFTFDELVDPTEGDSKIEWTCGHIPIKIWGKSSKDLGIVIRSNCVFHVMGHGSSLDSTRIETSLFRSCQNICLSDHRWNTFSYDFSHSVGVQNCILPFKSIKLNATNMSVLSFAEVLSNHNMETTSTGNHCAVLPSRNWTVNLLNQVVESAGNKGSVIYLYRQDDCDFIGFNIIEVIPTKQNSFNDCSLTV